MTEANPWVLATSESITRFNRVCWMQTRRDKTPACLNSSDGRRQWWDLTSLPWTQHKGSIKREVPGCPCLYPVYMYISCPYSTQSGSGPQDKDRCSHTVLKVRTCCSNRIKSLQQIFFFYINNITLKNKFLMQTDLFDLKSYSLRKWKYMKNTDQCHIKIINTGKQCVFNVVYTPLLINH